MAELYRVILLGGAEGSAPADIKEKIARLFKLPEEKVEQLLARAPVVVNRGLSPEAARKLATALERCGARVRFEPLGQEPEEERLELESAQAAAGPGAGARPMVCPSCGQSQPEAETCIFCGKVVAKVQEAIRQRQAEAGEDRQPERRRKPRPLPEIELRPMSVGEMLSEAFTMLRERLAVFAGISVLVPLGLMTACVLVFGAPLFLYAKGFQASLLAARAEALAQMAAESPAAAAGPGVGAILTIIVLACLLLSAISFVALWEQAALTYAVSERHLGHEIGVVASYQSVLRRMVPLSWTGFTTFSLVALLFIGLMIPGSFLGPLGAVAAGIAAACYAIRYLLVEKVVILEGLSGGEARSRSTELVSGKALRLLAVIISFGLVAALVKLSVNVFGLLLTSLPVVLRALGELGLALLAGTIAGALPSMGLCLFYYDARLRTDGSLSYEELARNL